MYRIHYLSNSRRYSNQHDTAASRQACLAAPTRQCRLPTGIQCRREKKRYPTEDYSTRKSKQKL